MAAEDYHDFSALDDFDYMSQYDEPRRLTTRDKLPRWTFNKQKKEVDMKKINKFYVGAQHIAEAIELGGNSEWTHPTFEAAVEHGKMIMDRDDKDMILVVKIVGIMKRQKNPVKVTKL